jgi:hypothetical protein
MIITLFPIVVLIIALFVWALCRAAAKPSPNPVPLNLRHRYGGNSGLCDCFKDQPWFDDSDELCPEAVRKNFAEGRAPQICTRRAPHECAVNGPCNGFPRRTYAEGRPTMPSEVEPQSETERRTR